MNNGSLFSATIDSFVLGAKANAIAIVRASIQEIALRAVWTTPVLTGFLRASWQPSIDAPPPIPLDKGRAGVRVSYEESGVEIPVNLVVGQVMAVLAKLQPGQTFYLVNNARYAMRLEFGFTGVDSKGRQVAQRGRHWVQDAVKQWRPIVESQVRLMSGRSERV